MEKWRAIFVISLLVVFPLVAIAVVTYKSNQTKKELEKLPDELERYIAIHQLSTLKGMILEVESFSHKNISQSVLLNELESISKHFTSLDDFTFNIPSTSNVGELCEEFISQIDNQIYTIWCKG